MDVREDEHKTSPESLSSTSNLTWPGLLALNPGFHDRECRGRRPGRDPDHQRMGTLPCISGYSSVCESIQPALAGKFPLLSEWCSQSTLVGSPLI